MTAPSLSTALLRGVLRKCPRCGVGSLFAGYLKRVETCPHCGESFDGVDADDGPAWLTIGLVAHIIVPLLIFLESAELLPYPVEMAVLLGVTIVASLALLPLCKGLFLAAVWSIAARKTS